MNTKPVPVIITLLAAGISCVASVIQGVDFSVFTTRLLVTVICFLILGSVIKVVADRSLKILKEEPQSEEGAEGSQENMEDIQAENESKEEA